MGVFRGPESHSQYTYLLSLGLQRLQGVGHSFQLFLKLSAFANVLHKRVQKKNKKRKVGNIARGKG